MEANRKRVQVHMLPTEDKTSQIHLEKDTKELVYSLHNLYYRANNYQTQHLYFTTDEEIKEGDWMMNLNGDKIYQHFGNGGDFEQWNKIIATTDPELELPQPSQAFIKAYCEQGGFDEVDVEYEINPILDLEILDGKTRLKETIFIPKVDPIHNTITTYRIVEKMYSRENLENLMMQSYIYGQSDKTDSFHKRESTIEKLIKENL